jgi:hypothetical protein
MFRAIAGGDRVLSMSGFTVLRDIQGENVLTRMVKGADKTGAPHLGGEDREERPAVTIPPSTPARADHPIR